MIHLLQMSDLVIYGYLNKDLHNGSYVVRDKYLTTYGVACKLTVFRSGRYQSIRNGGIGGGRGQIAVKINIIKGKILCFYNRKAIRMIVHLRISYFQIVPTIE